MATIPNLILVSTAGSTPSSVLKQPPPPARSAELNGILRAFGYFINIGHFVHLCPYYYDRKQERLYFDKRLRYKLSFFLQLFLLLAYDLFLGIQCFRVSMSTTSQEVKPKLKARLLYYTRFFMMLSPSMLLASTQFGAYTTLFNALMDVEEDFRRKYNLRTGTKSTKRVVWVILTGCVFGGLAFPRDMLRHPEVLHLLTSVVSNRAALLPFWALHSMHFFSLVYYVGFMLMLLLLFLTIVLPAVELIRIEDHRRHGNRMHVCTVFRILTVLQRVFTSVLGPWTLLIVLVCIMAITLSLFQGFVLGNWITTLLGSMVLVVLEIFTKRCGSLYETCVVVMRTWQRLEDGVAFSRWRKSCKPLRVKIGALAFFDRGIMLTFTNIILSNTVTLMLSHR